MFAGLGHRARHARDLVRDWYYSRVATQTEAIKYPEGFWLVGTKAPVHRAMQEGAFDPDERTVFLDALAESDRLIDVGANIGVYTALALHRGVPVLAVEPQPLNTLCLQQMLTLNHWTAELAAVAVGDSEGTATLYGASSSGASFIRGWAGYSARHQQIVPMTTLDALVGDRFAGERLLIKIDVEGAEATVLDGAARTLRRQPRPIWLVEICERQYHPGGQNGRYRETFDRFTHAGYKVQPVSGINFLFR
jgi:FkbM family methyltransferase